jgi:hypothetical protein
MRLAGLGKLNKKSITYSGIEPAIFPACIIVPHTNTLTRAPPYTECPGINASDSMTQSLGNVVFPIIVSSATAMRHSTFRYGTFIAWRNS